jgi:hypothetical protein
MLQKIICRHPKSNALLEKEHPLSELRRRYPDYYPQVAAQPLAALQPLFDRSVRDFIRAWDIRNTRTFVKDEWRIAAMSGRSGEFMSAIREFAEHLWNVLQLPPVPSLERMNRNLSVFAPGMKVENDLWQKTMHIALEVQEFIDECRQQGRDDLHWLLWEGRREPAGTVIGDHVILMTRYGTAAGVPLRAFDHLAVPNHYPFLPDMETIMKPIGRYRRVADCAGADGQAQTMILQYDPGSQNEPVPSLYT